MTKGVTVKKLVTLLISTVYFYFLYGYMYLEYIDASFNMQLLTMVYCISLYLINWKDMNCTKFRYEYVLLMTTVCVVAFFRKNTFADDWISFFNILFLIISFSLLYKCSEKIVRQLFWALLIAIIPHFFKWVYHYFHISDFYVGNRYGLSFAFACTVILYLFANSKYKYLIMAGGSFVLVISQCRTGLISFAVSTVLLLYFDFKEKLTKRKLLLYLFLTITICFTIYLNWNQIYHLVFNKWAASTSSDESSMSIRISYWIEAFRQNTFLGLEPNYTMNMFGVSNCHNAYVQAYIQFGWLGFVTYIAFVILTLLQWFKNRKKLNRYLVLILAFLITMSFVESNFAFDATYPLYGMFFIILSGQASKARKKKAQKVAIRSEEDSVYAS